VHGGGVRVSAVPPSSCTVPCTASFGTQCREARSHAECRVRPPSLPGTGVAPHSSLGVTVPYPRPSNVVKSPVIEVPLPTSPTSPAMQQDPCGPPVLEAARHGGEGPGLYGGRGGGRWVEGRLRGDRIPEGHSEGYRKGGTWRATPSRTTHYALRTSHHTLRNM
jgi:hypothetical protein